MAKNKKVDQESFDDFLEREYGKGVIINASDVVHRKRDILRTVPSLDISLSGGIPDGNTVLISGKAKSGKSTLCLQILKNAIDNNRPAFYVDIERRCSQSLIKTIEGLDSEKLRVIKSTPERIFSAEDWLRIIERTIKDNKKAVIVVDSLAMLSTLAEQSELLGESRDMAGVPKLMASFFRRIQQTVDDNDIVLIFISQLMTNRDPGGKKWSEKGGQSVQYAVSVWLNVTWVKLWDKDPDTNSPQGQDVMVNVVCSALGKPYLPCAIPLRFGHGIDICRDIALHSENLGLIKKAGAWYSIPMFKENDEPVKFQGMSKLCDYLTNNKDKINILESEIRKMLLIDES